VGLALRSGSAVAATEVDRATAIATLLSVHAAGEDGIHPLLRGATSRRNRRYREERLAAGDPITIVGRAMPFGDLSDPTEADVALGTNLAADDVEVAGDIAEARAAAVLVGDPVEAWGNAAIPGFGIGRLTQAPELDPAPDRPRRPAARSGRCGAAWRDRRARSSPGRPPTGRSRPGRTRCAGRCGTRRPASG